MDGDLSGRDMGIEWESVGGVGWLLSLAGFVEEDRESPSFFYDLSVESHLLVRTVLGKGGHNLLPGD